MENFRCISRKDEQCEIIYLLRAARCKSIFLLLFTRHISYSVSTIYWQFSIRKNIEELLPHKTFIKSIKLILLSFNYLVMAVSHLLPTQNLSDIQGVVSFHKIYVRFLFNLLAQFFLNQQSPTLVQEKIDIMSGY